MNSYQSTAIKKINLRMPYISQGINSSNCGPCMLKMLADYYGIHSSKGIPYTVASLNRLCRVAFDYGCEKSDINRVLREMGLKRRRVGLRELSKYLQKGIPVMGLLYVNGCGHYTIIKGYERVYDKAEGRYKDRFILHDSYYGRNRRLLAPLLKKQGKYFGNWFWAITRD